MDENTCKHVSVTKYDENTARCSDCGEILRTGKKFKTYLAMWFYVANRSEPVLIEAPNIPTAILAFPTFYAKHSMKWLVSEVKTTGEHRFNGDLITETWRYVESNGEPGRIQITN